MSPARSARFITLKNSPAKLNPGPGQYSPSGEFSKEGSYFVSKFSSSMCRTHYHADRSTFKTSRMSTPGPGTYRLPSDFGYYEARKSSEL
jgi:hypothetical protein